MVSRHSCMLCAQDEFYWRFETGDPRCTEIRKRKPIVVHIQFGCWTWTRGQILGSNGKFGRSTLLVLVCVCVCVCVFRTIRVCCFAKSQRDGEVVATLCVCGSKNSECVQSSHVSIVDECIGNPISTNQKEANDGASPAGAALHY